MKRLLLASASQGIAALTRLVGGETRGLRFLFVPTAAGPDGWENDWVQRDRRQFDILGCELAVLDLATAEADEVKKALVTVDGVFLTGGNAHLLLWRARRSGFAELVVPTVESGSLLYIGTSAGALLAGSDLAPAAAEGNRSAVPELASTRGLGLVDFMILPHDQEPDRAARHDGIVASHPEHEFVRLTDEMAVVVRGDEREVVALPPA
jgi:dipeptidase E